MKSAWAFGFCLFAICGCGGGAPTQPSTAVSAPKLILTAADLKTIAWIGDSYAVQNNITGPFETALQSKYGNGGIGWIDLYYLSDVQPGVTVGAAGTWAAQRWVPTSTGLNLSDIRTSDVTTPARITVTVEANTASATLFYLQQPGGGTFKWWVDSSAAITINAAAASTSIGTSVISGLSNSDAHTFQLQIVSAGTAGICIEGMDLRSSTSGVVVHNLGSAGSDTNNWAGVNAALWESQLATVDPSMVIIMLTPNDQAAGISVSQEAANLATLIARIRDAMPNVPIILAPPPDNGLNRTPSMAEYNTSQAGLAKTLGVGYIDVLDPMGPFNASYFDSDLMHPNEEGGSVISTLVLDGINLFMQ
jgi:lysophospholipase L1-like esterase